MVIGITLLFVGASIGPINAQTNSNYPNFTNLPTSPILPFRQIIGSNDEGSHYKNNTYHQEWWYYIAIFNKEDSELKNWSMMVSFNQMGIIDVLFCAIFEESNINYGGVTNRWKGTMQASGPGVNVIFENSSILGRYPNWHIYAEHKKTNETSVIINVTYKANSLPMWLFFNMGFNNSNSRIGHYCIIESDVNGTVIINETSYHVNGVGYHEHSWTNGGKIKQLKSLISCLKKRNKSDGIPEWQFLLDVWDWSAIFLDNGWNIFSAKICQQSPLSKILPGSLWITTDKGKHITECNYFQFKYLETINTTIPSLKIPTKIHINAVFLKPFFKNPFNGLVRLNLFIEVKNLREFSWHGHSSGYNFSIGVWEAYFRVYGDIKWLNNCVDLNGSGMLEFTRAKKW